ncbi:MAG TPA: hypothetical protein VNJ01_11425 [Bacteriovoracaceae bacterium]|nr:hypothetical protein [Bacteriovoracaceae bacterium]
MDYMKNNLLTYMAFALGVFFVCSAMARPLEEKSLYYKINTGALMSEDIQYYYVQGTPEDLYKKIPEAFELVALPLLREKDVVVILLKSTFMVNRPAGFFDHEHMTNEKYVSHIMAGQTVRKSGDFYKVSVPGPYGHSFQMQTFFDSDDISTLPKSKASKIVATSKKLDVIAQGASATIVNEYSDFSRHLRGGTSVISYMSLKENKTLVVYYKMMVLKRNYADSKTIRESFLTELTVLKKQIDSFESPRPL